MSPPVPQVSRSYGIVIRMYFADDAPAHFHAEYGEHEALIGIEDLRVIGGSLPARAFAWFRSGPLFTRRNWRPCGLQLGS
jgi:hypothetical protein